MWFGVCYTLFVCVDPLSQSSRRDLDYLTVVVMYLRFIKKKS